MQGEDPLVRFEDTLRQTARSEIRDGALADRETAIRELQYIHHKIMIEVDKVAAAQQGANLNALIDTVERIVSGETENV